MIPFEEIDYRLTGIDKTRAWLAETSGRKPSSIGDALAPNASATKRSGLLQKALTDAIEKEEARQREATAIPIKPAIVLPDRVTIQCQPEERRKWEATALDQGHLLDDWIVSSLNRCADLHLGLNQPAQGNGTTGHP